MGRHKSYNVLNQLNQSVSAYSIVQNNLEHLYDLIIRNDTVLNLKDINNPFEIKSGYYFDEFLLSTDKITLDKKFWNNFKFIEVSSLKIKNCGGGSFEERINELQNEFNETGNVKCLTKISQLRGEYKAIILKELSRKLKKVKRVIKLILRQINKVIRYVLTKIIGRFFRLQSNACDDEFYLEFLIVDGIKNFKLKLNENENKNMAG